MLLKQGLKNAKQLFLKKENVFWKGELTAPMKL